MAHSFEECATTDFCILSCLRSKLLVTKSMEVFKYETKNYMVVDGCNVVRVLYGMRQKG